MQRICAIEDMRTADQSKHPDACCDKNSFGSPRQPLNSHHPAGQSVRAAMETDDIFIGFLDSTAAAGTISRAGRPARLVTRRRIGAALVEWILDAVAAHAADRGTALFPGCEPAVSCTSSRAVLGTPWINYFGDARWGTRQHKEHSDRRSPKIIAHSQPPVRALLQFRHQSGQNRNTRQRTSAVSVG